MTWKQDHFFMKSEKSVISLIRYSMVLLSYFLIS